MAKWLTIVGLFAVTFVMTGCGGGGGGQQAAKLSEVSGTVSMDGKPMPEGEISFAELGGGPAIIKIKDGKFEGKVSAGEKRVEIKAFRPGQPIMMNGAPTGDPVPENYIPAKYNSASTFKATIGATGSKDLKYEITSM